MREPVQVLVYVTRQGGGQRQYLLLHRVARRDDVFWQGVTGAPEAGESLVQAALRELVEETGIVTEKLIELDLEYTFPLKAKWADLYAPDVTEIREYVFVTEVPETTQPRLDPREHDAWRWCKLDEALNLLQWPNNADALRHAHQWLESSAP